MILVQKLITVWTKASRGGAGATVRNATPKALQIPYRGDASPDSVLFQQVRYDEYFNFSPRETVTIGPLAALRDSADELDLQLEDGVLRVVFAWNERCGAPRRPSSRAIRIRQGQWCCLLYNGRRPYESFWHFETTIVNIGIDVDDDAFTSSAPLETSDNRAPPL